MQVSNLRAEIPRPVEDRELDVESRADDLNVCTMNEWKIDWLMTQLAVLLCDISHQTWYIVLRNQ